MVGRKIFISYKYKDNDVRMLSGVTQPTWPCDYVDYIQRNVISSKYIYKGEKKQRRYFKLVGGTNLDTFKR